MPMPLRGTVRDYGLADVLQLISGGARSGRLRLEHGAEVLEWALSSGTVVDVRTDRALDGALGSRLVQAGLLSDDVLGLALAERARTGYPIARILVQGGHLSEDEIREQSTLHRWDLVLAPFTWDGGSYTFDDVELTNHESWAEPLGVDHILMRGLRLVDEWPEASDRVPSRSWVVARRVPLPPPAPEPDPFSIVEVAPSGDPQVSDEAREIHAVAAPGARVGRILARARLDRFETTLALAELSKRGYIVLTPP